MENVRESKDIIKNYEKTELGDEEIREKEKSIELTPRVAQGPF